MSITKLSKNWMKGEQFSDNLKKEVDNMTDTWFVDPEFHKVFKRANEHTEMKGCRTPTDIRRRMDSTIKAYDIAIRTGYIKEEKVKHRFIFAKKNLKKLRDSEFPEATIARARRNPDGIVGQTLLHGYSKAKAIILARRQRLRRMTRIRRRRLR